MGKEYDWGAALVSAHVGVQVAGDLTVAGVSLVSPLGRPLPLPGFCFESDAPGKGLAPRVGSGSVHMGFGIPCKKDLPLRPHLLVYLITSFSHRLMDTY